MVQGSDWRFHEVVINWEDNLQYLEEIDIETNSEQSREDVNRAHAEYTRWMSLQESLLKQKTQIKWFEDGDCNTKYFHCILREKKGDDELIESRVVMVGGSGETRRFLRRQLNISLPYLT